MVFRMSHLLQTVREQVLDKISKKDEMAWNIVQVALTMALKVAWNADA